MSEFEFKCMCVCVCVCVNKRAREREKDPSQVFSLSTLMKVWILRFKVKLIRMEDNIVREHLQMASDEANYECWWPGTRSQPENSSSQLVCVQQFMFVGKQIGYTVLLLGQVISQLSTVRGKHFICSISQLQGVLWVIHGWFIASPDRWLISFLDRLLVDCRCVLDWKQHG